MSINSKPLCPSKTVADFLARKHQLLIDNKWVDAASGEMSDVVDPGTGKVIAKASAGSAIDVHNAVVAARKAFDIGPWTKMTPDDRSKIIWKLAELLEAAAPEFAEIESVNTGKPLSHCLYVDIAASHQLLRYAAGWPSKILGDTMRLSTPFSHHAFTVRQPIGVAGIIVPWNFPLNLAVARMVPALAAGCTVVLKPAEQTPLTALRLGELVLEAGFPEGVINIVTGLGETAGAALVDHHGVDKISFTGSTEVGREIVRRSTGNLKKLTLELGGKSPMVVFDDADMDLTIPTLAMGIFFGAGQVCTAGSRLFVHEKVFDHVMDGIVQAASRMKIGYGLDAESELGPLISERQRKRIVKLVQDGIADGAELLTGGAPLDGPGYFMQPTVLAHTTTAMAVHREEVFGPVLCANRFSDEDFDQLAKIVNDTEFGLASSIFTTNLTRAHEMAKRIQAGNVWVNTHHCFDGGLPIGGFKESGWGRSGGGFEPVAEFLETKGVVVRL